MKKWPPRNLLAIGQHNVQHVPLVDHNKVFLPPFHITLGLMKQFVAAIDHTNRGFQCLRGKFGKMKTDTILKADNFVRP